MKQWLKRAKVLCAGLFLALMMVVSVGVNAAQATSNIDPDRQAGVTLHYSPGQTTVSIYKIANITPQSKFTVLAPFDAEPFSSITQIQQINDLDAEGYSNLASTLKVYIDTGDIKPYLVAETDENGYYANDNLGTGMFLAITEEDEDYAPQPALFSLPGSLGEDGEWVYTLDVELKYEQKIHNLTAIKVIKTWVDKNNTNATRPDSIEVNLMRDKEVEETVELNEENSWQYQWEDLEEGYQWNVVEATVPDGYTYSNNKKENTVTITNTLKNNGGGSQGGSGGGTTQAKTTAKSTLPKTGQLWWPVPFLCIGGAAAFIVGYIRRKRWEKDHVR